MMSSVRNVESIVIMQNKKSDMARTAMTGNRLSFITLKLFCQHHQYIYHVYCAPGYFIRLTFFYILITFHLSEHEVHLFCFPGH